MTNSFLDGIRTNDHRVLSRVITHIENDHGLTDEFFISLYKYSTDAIRIGITGPPGAGKSTLTDRLIALYLEHGKSVGVVAVDPTSPFTGGALLGDRVRMNKYIWEDQVFIRSMGSHGDLGGLARKAQDVGDVLAASGKDIIIYETVGVGQGEHDVAAAVDLTLVILVPESGDEIQMMKAGLIEIADLFVINKSDRDGANRLAQLLQNILHTSSGKDKTEPPVVKTIASDGKGVDELFETIETQLNQMKSNGAFNAQRLEKHQTRVLGLVKEKLLNEFWTSEKLETLSRETHSIDSMKLSPYEISAALLKNE
ncbi:MAG: methylmalonyl Co-A mutase-associated GTPase MeaB [Fidelibacterota bacterium]